MDTWTKFKVVNKKLRAELDGGYLRYEEENPFSFWRLVFTGIAEKNARVITRYKWVGEACTRLDETLAKNGSPEGVSRQQLNELIYDLDRVCTYMKEFQLVSGITLSLTGCELIEDH